MKPNSTSSRHTQWPVILAILTAGAGICLSLYIRSGITQSEAATARLTAETLRLNTEQELTLFVEVLESVRALHALSDEVNQAAMDEFIEKGLVHQHAVLGPFGLAQRISPQVRSVLEKEAAEQGTGYRVVQKGSDETWVPADPRTAYYPLTWQSRTEELCIPIGFDFSSIPNALQTIRRIEQTRRTALVQSPIPDFSSPLSIKNQKSKIKNAPAPTYWVFAPVAPKRFKSLPMYAPNAVIGFAVAALNPDTILKRVAAHSALSPELRLSLIDPADPDCSETIRLIDGKWLYCHLLEAMDAHWMFECSLPVAVTGRHSTATLLFGLIITAFMSSLFLIIGGRTQKIEAEVCARTEDLRIANVRLEENLHERAKLEEEMSELTARERRRIGRDLHDSLGQKLAGSVFLSRSLLDYFSNSRDQDSGDEERKTEDRRQRIEDEDQGSGIVNRESPTGNQQAHAKTLNETLKSAVGQVRNMARGLAPVTLNDESLSEALRQLTEEMTGLYGVSCELTESADLPSLDRKTKEQLYLIAREAVNNAARHAQAEHVKIQMNDDESGWQLCVEDNGKGLPGIQPAEEGMGIRIMRHRARLIGAKFTIHSAPDIGTRITVESQRS